MRSKHIRTNNGLSVCLYYGANRSVTAKDLKNYDVVLTTCMSSFVLSNNRRCLGKCLSKTKYWIQVGDGIHKERSLLHSIEFFRVILDEAYNIKDHSCNTARAAFALKTQCKLCLSGTSLQNRVFTLMLFLI